MALIKCPECAKEVSDLAPSCPHCGYPIKGDHTPLTQMPKGKVNMTLEERALQMWQILICTARNQQSITYGELSDMTGMPRFALANPLYAVQRHCQKSELPPLTVLVVSKLTGGPSKGYAPKQGVSKDRETVFSFDWHKERPRQAADFAP